MQRLLAVLLLGCLANVLKAQNISNRGKEFWVGYGHHQFMEPGQTNSQEMVIYLSAEQAATVVVSINGTTWTRTYNVPANTVIATEYMPKNGVDDCRLYSVPPSFGGTGGEGIFNRGINIKSNVPIVAYAHTFGSASSGATMLLPVDSWGNQYYSLNSRQSYQNNCFSWAYVVAQQDNTVVEITPSVETRTLKPAGVPFTVTLNKGQIYQIIGNNPTGGNSSLEVSGTKFRSIANASGVCAPVAVFSGSSRTYNTISCGSGGGDNDNQQAFPTKTWGKHYLTAPTSRSTAANQFMTNSYKVLVKDPATVVKRNGIQLTGLTNNYYFFESTTADYIEADKPIMVAQFMTGGNSCLGAGVGDPEMMFISPIEQGIKKVAFYRNNREAITINYLTMIIPTNGIPSLRIDGSAAFDHSYPHPQKPGYSIVVKRWNSAQAQATASSDSSFTAITYGLGNVESYGYNAGTYLNNLNLVGSIRNDSDTSTIVKQHDYTCKNSPIRLSAFYLYKPVQLVWELSTLAPVLSPAVNVTDNSPVAVDSSVINGLMYYKYTLPGTYSFSDTGTFTIPITSSHPSIENCTLSERLTYTITVKPTPRPVFTFTHSGCTLDTIAFAAQATTLNTYNNTLYTWTFPGPSTATTRLVNKVLPPGNHLVSLRVVTDNGCVGDTIQPVNVFNKPTADFTIAPLSTCVGSNITLTDNSVIGGSGTSNSYYWDFGNGNTTTVSGNAPQTVVFTNPGTYTIRHTAQSSTTCVSDTVSRSITIYAKPSVNFTYPATCLPSNGTLPFTGIASVSDGQTLTGFAWNFGDPNATAGNPNTSAVQSPTHIYQQGTYPVNFSVTTQQSCVKDTTINVIVKINPALNYPAINPVCQNDAVFSIATATVTNSVAGTGTYRGPGTTAAGNFTPALAGVGTHQVWYIFTTAAGCKDSVSQTIQVKAKPVVSYTYPTGGCLPTTGQAQFNGAAALSDGQTVNTWAWDFNDPNATAGNPNTSTAQNPSHNFTANGIYNVKLTATSSGGCSGDTTIALNFNIRPALNYPALASVCHNIGGTLSVASATVTNGVTGTGTYTGPGTTAAGVFTPAAAGVGTHTIWYKFTTPNGCADSISQTIQVKAKPVVSYTYPTGGCLPATGQAQFNGAAALSDGQTVNTWAWDFNDPNATAGNPNTSTAQNPSHNFTANGIYNVKLTATSSGNCTGDTTIALNFNIKPTLAYPVLADRCQDVTTPVSIATATVTNGAAGTGIYTGPATTTAGMFTPSVAGAGTHIIWYKFTTPNGCADSISQTVTVNPKPLAGFTATAAVCDGGAVTVTDASTVTPGTINQWKWSYGDGNTANNTNGNPFTITYGTYGNYTIKLVAVSNQGCTSDTFRRDVIVNPLPVAAFTSSASVCLPGGTVSFTNQSTIPNSGALSYSWDFGDGSPASNNPNPGHVYAAAGNYTITLTTASAAGCSTSVNHPFNAFFVKPLARFEVNPDTLCQGADNVFTDLSTDPGGSNINAWAWAFADGATSITKNPVKRYTQPGTYNVTLRVTNAAGCTSEVFTLPVVVYLQPTVDAGPSFIVPQGTTVTFSPVTNSPSLTYSWFPSFGLSGSMAMKPSLVANSDQLYTLTVTGEGGCTASDFLTVKVLKKIDPPNAFSPNGDGVNDTWEIANLSDYNNCVVRVFNRYGQQLYESNGYAKPWNGVVNGSPLPVGTYYYIIELKNGLPALNGSLTIIR